MSNHFHLVTETPRANLVRGMQWLLGVYTNRFNHRQKEFGHLFSGRYKPLPVDSSGNGYLKSVCVGSEEFRQELLAQVSQLASPKHAGEEIRQSALAKAERIVKEELDALRWAAEALRGGARVIHKKFESRRGCGKNQR